jgi:hypothetical protein
MDTSNNFFPMDLGAMPMQTDTTGLPNEQSRGQQPTNTNPFGQNMFVGVSDASCMQREGNDR